MIPGAEVRGGRRKAAAFDKQTPKGCVTLGKFKSEELPNA
jgi:hypothetical protein